ncbi:MAG: hypothetical protein KDA28_11975, partial [Phycisphaerales bacterium]|nr:hypothetical protein [Phycisphaerales bacterium]
MLSFPIVLTIAASQPWSIHDMDRALPPRVEGVHAITTPPPSDAIVLFDGSEASGFQHANGSDVKWAIRDGFMEVVRGSGQIQSRDAFGDAQVHIEGLVPESESGDDGQQR